MQGRKSWLKEPFCGLSHLVGAVLSAIGLVALLIVAHGRPLHLVAFTVYGASLIVLYTSSAVYHSLHVSPRAVERLQRLDYISIFLLIAGTYTPVCLLTLRGVRGLTLLGAEWGIAFAGIATVVFWKSAPHWFRVPLYIGMGWLAVFSLPQLRALWPPPALAWLIAGGLIYTLGTIFYALNRPHLWRGSRLGTHDLWHLFVMAGSLCHFIVVLRYIR